MISIMHIDRLALWGQHGVILQEKVVGAMFYVSLRAEVDVTEVALIHDRLEGTVSYADVIDTIRQEMTVPSALLENLVYRIGKRILKDYQTVKTLTIRVDKENPPCGVSAENIGVSMKFIRE